MLIPLRCTSGSLVDWKAMQENPHKRLIGRRVMVIGANVYKGAKGIIQDVTPVGDASMFLDIFNEKRPRMFKIQTLCLV